MDLAHTLSWLTWTVPTLLVGVMTIVLSFVRRDEGSWWKVLLGGGALLVVYSVVGLGEWLLGSMTDPVDSALLYQVIGFAQSFLLVAAICLILAGAHLNRRSPATTPRQTEPTA